ncbi:CD320 antigen [Hemicordylus capensis]|uniref:CD320 antigen n=1 Tax=Hemicordylus capensis TaxID=884348 RepID=UPI0023042ED7|nr:CD320 antigen [Hemicordylus capensis]
MELLLLLSLLLTAAWRFNASSGDYFTCTIGSFHCLDTGHVPLCLRCDGKPDCRDGSDESGCQAGNVSCGPRGQQCGNGGPCLPRERFCDGHGDCPESSDESVEVCGNQTALPSQACPKGEFQCAPGAECFPLTWMCDGHPDCTDKRDELGCDLDLQQSSVTPQTDAAAGPGVELQVRPEVLLEIAIFLLLSVTVVTVCVAVWCHREAEQRLASFNLAKVSEHLMAEEQP